MIAILWTLLVIILTFYAPIELTRVILPNLSRAVGWEAVEYFLEILVIWIQYAAAISIVGILTSKVKYKND